MAWTVRDQILWNALGELAKNNAYYLAELKVSPHKDRFTWPATPFDSADDANTSRIGHVAVADQAAAVDYLLALSPPASS